MRVLVTGGLGVNGAWVVRELLDSGHTPVAFDARDDTALVADIADEFDRVKGDVTDLGALKSLLSGCSFDAVIHLAALLPAESDPYLGYRVNALGTVTVLEASRAEGVGRVVHASTKAVFGEVTGPYGPPELRALAEEDLPYNVIPSMPVYSASKIFSEHAVRQYRDAYDMSVLALRFATIYGPGKQARHGGIGVLSQIVENAVDGRGTAVTEGAEAQDDLVYVRDVARSLVSACAAAEPAHWTLNIGSGRLTSLADFCEVVRDEAGPVEISLGSGWDYLGTGPIYPFMDITRARAELGWEPRYSVRDGVRDYVASVRARKAAV